MATASPTIVAAGSTHGASHPLATGGGTGVSFKAWTWWAGVAGWWTLSGIMSAAQVQTMRAGTSDAGSLFLVVRPAMVSAYLWIPITMFALWSASKLPLERGRIAGPLMMHAVAACCVALLRVGAVILLNDWVGWYRELPDLAQLVVTSLNNNIVIYGLLVGAGHAVHYGSAAAAKQELLAHARLHVLKSQLQPHFLFNTLNTISAYVRTDPMIAEEMIDRLGALLRHSLNNHAAHEVSLADELAGLRPYLDIEEVRFGDRLTVTIRADPRALSAAVPHFLLQPLVENAIRHGTSVKGAPSCIDISVMRHVEHVVVQVADDGVGPPAGFCRDHWGVGLQNTASRLQQLYGGAGTLEVGCRQSGGTVATIRLPFKCHNRSN